MDWIEILFTRTWWSWSRDAALPYSTWYRGFNLFEAAAWSAVVTLNGARMRWRISITSALA